jgi:hypothetical protein
MSSVLPLPLPTEGAADRLTEAAARAERDKERVVLIRDGKPVAAVVPIEDLEAEDEYWSRAADEAIGEWEAAGRPAFRLRISRAIWASTWRPIPTPQLDLADRVPSVGEGRIAGPGSPGTSAHSAQSASARRRSPLRG